MTTLTATRHALAVDHAACAHCGLEVPQGLIDQHTERQFCCAGCRSVHAIIHSGGLDRYYALRRQLERRPRRVGDDRTDLSAFDDPAFAAAYTAPLPDGSRRATLALEGMHCAACVWLIERLDRITPGVLSATADYRRATAEVRWDPRRTNFGRVARGLASLGYRPSPPRAGVASHAHRDEARRQLVRIGVAGALAGNVMLVTVALYAGLFDGIEELWRTLFRWVSAGLGLLALAWPGRVFFQGALASLRARVPQLDLPISVALLAGGAWGCVNTVRGTGEIYFDSIATLVFLLLVGRFVQAQQQRRAADAVELMLSVAPSTVRIEDADGSAAVRSTESARAGDVALVHAGETIPADGQIIQGITTVDQSLLTGESRPIDAGPGSPAWAGAVNLTGTIRVRIAELGAETRAARLMRLVADAASSKAGIVQLADRLAGVFTIVMLALAAATAAAWALIDPAHAVEHATALLIVTCPCALGLATPLVLSAAIGRLARAGVLVKTGEALERLAVPGNLILDKTGTVTSGRPRMIDHRIAAETLARLRALEGRSAHPLARAIAGDDPPAMQVEHDRQVQGLGISGVVAGVEILAGSAAMLEAHSVPVPEDIRAWAQAHARDGHTPVLVAEQGRCTGGVITGDAIRPEAAGVVRRIAELGWRISLLSGDHPAVVDRVADRLGLPTDAREAQALPEDKLAAVRATVAGAPGPTVMVGDGVNDAAALAAADVGVAMQGGADASLDAADVLVQRGGMLGVERLLRGSRDAMRRVRLCLAVSLAYNVIAAALAVTGHIHPLLAAVLMPVSSASVVLIAGHAPRREREDAAWPSS